ncbi:MAG: hypothetical protein WC985_10840, partial [Thermoplasmata archaeon]
MASIRTERQRSQRTERIVPAESRKVPTRVEPGPHASVGSQHLPALELPLEAAVLAHGHRIQARR